MAASEEERRAQVQEKVKRGEWVFPAKVRRALEEGRRLFWVIGRENREMQLRALTAFHENGSVTTRFIWSDPYSTWRASWLMNEALLAAGAKIEPKNWKECAVERFDRHGIPYCPGQEWTERNTGYDGL